VLRLEITKSGKRREVPLNAAADAVLARRRQTSESHKVFPGPWSTYRKSWERAVEKAGLDDIRFHDTRHTFASWAIQRGVSLPELQQPLGHATLTMTMRYAHLAPEHLRSAVSKLDGVLDLAPAEIGQMTSASFSVVESSAAGSRS
jgi:integrase